MSDVVPPFQAFLIRQDENRKVSAAMESMTVDALDAGEVLIRVAYSSVNYKDALAATGAGKIIRRFPCVGGTAGFTAAPAIGCMEDNGLAPANGPVIVTGASGGVGGLAIDMLAGLGYHVVALTGKAHEEGYLKGLGAAEIRLRDTIDPATTRPMDAGLWAGAVDNAGGDILAWVLSTMKQAGTVASIGNAQSIKLNTTVFPFILRGVSLLGIDSGYMGEPTRTRVWQRLATDLKPRHLATMTKMVSFAELPGVFNDFIEGRVKGRTVIAVK